MPFDFSGTKTTKSLAGAMVLMATVFMATMGLAAVSDAQERTIRVGLVGLDTSHAVAFTQLLNDALRPDHVPGARVVAAFKWGSPDIEASASRIEKFTAELRDTWKIELVDSIDELVRRVDAVVLASVDGRVHLAQARAVLAARKPLFVDKPFTASVKDAVALFSSSSLRYTDDVQGVKRDPRVQQVQGAITWGPATLEPHHPDLFWYGIHAVEMLYTFMGPGCERVTRTHTAGADAVVGYWKDGRIGIVRGTRDSAQTYGQVVFGPKAIVTSPEPSNTASNTPSNTPSNGPPPKRSSYYGLLVEIVEFFHTGKSPVPIDETLEIMAFMEAAELSKARTGAPVTIAEVLSSR
jgi:hypothetical protein